MYNIRGYYTPLTIDETLFVFVDKQAQASWKQVQELQAKITAARESLAEAEAAAIAAPDADREAALEAVSLGKPAPAETASKAHEAVATRQREIDALLTLADKAERQFVGEVIAQRDSIEKAARKSLEAGIHNLIDACGSIQTELTYMYRMNGMWQWGRGNDDAQLPGESRVTARVDFHKQDIRNLLDTVITALNKALPDQVDETERNLAEWNAQIRGGGVTPDGLVLDAAAYRAYR
jgi:DNA-binding protein YbaB